MGQTHIILRSVPLTESPGGSASPVSVEVETLPRGRAAEISRTRDVVAVAPVVPMKLIEPVSAPAAEDPLASGTTWGVQSVGADTSPFTGKGIVVAVLDTGIDPKHPAFAGVELERENFTDASDDDENGHGTHCAGTIFGRAVDGTRIGVATGVTRAMIGKVLGGNGGGSDVIVQAIQWAVNGGAHVVSMSLGIDFPGSSKQLTTSRGVPVELATSMALDAYRANVLLFERLASLIKAQNALMQASLLVAAAGNESRRTENPDFEIFVSPPAVSDGIVSVAAVGRGSKGLSVASFSNVGARVAGPGVGILSAKMGGGLSQKNGTSMATPHVAGVAALWAEKLSAARQLNGQLLADRLVGSATSDGMEAGFDPEDIGAGLVRAPRTDATTEGLGRSVLRDRDNGGRLPQHRFDIGGEKGESAAAMAPLEKIRSVPSGVSPRRHRHTTQIESSRWSPVWLTRGWRARPIRTSSRPFDRRSPGSRGSYAISGRTSSSRTTTWPSFVANCSQRNRRLPSSMIPSLTH